MAAMTSDWVQWEYSHKKLEHLTVTQKELLRQREQLRKALVAELTDIHSHDDWRFVVVAGPAGKGKTCFVKDQLERLGYPELAKKAAAHTTSSTSASSTPFAGMTSARPTPYVLDKHNVIIFDSVGTTPNFDLVRVEAVAADTLVVLVGEGAQIDQTHADACLLAWRLHHHMTTVFLLPKGDHLLAQDRGSASLPDFLAGSKLHIAQALHRRLAPYVAGRARELGVQLGADAHLFLQRVELETTLNWAAMLLLEPWLHMHAYWSETDPVSNRPRSSSTRGEVAELLHAESRAVEELVFGGCGGLVPSTVLKAAGVPVPVKLEVGAKGTGTEKASKDVPLAPSRSIRAQCHEIFVNELNNARAQASLFQRALLPFLEYKAAQSQATVLPHEWAVLLNSSNPALNELAVSYVKAFTTDQSANHTAIVEAGALRPLVTLLAAAARPTVQQNAAGALRNLAAHPPNRTLIADAGAIPPLVQLLSGPATTVERAAHALHNLSLADHNRNLIADAGAIAPLVLLISSAGGVRVSPRVQGHAAAVLRQLAVSEKNAVAIKRAGGIPPLIELVSAGRGEAQEHAVGCLKNLACCQEAQKEIARLGGIKPLVALIDASSGGPGVVTSVTLGALEEAAGALQKLARNNSINRKAIARDLGIKPLVQLLDIRDPKLQSEAAGALWELGLSDENECAIAEAGAIPRLVDMIRSHDKKVHYDAVGALFVLSFHDNHKAVIHESGGVPPLVHLLDSDNIRVREFAAKTLANLAVHKRAIRKQIVDEGAASGLRRLQRCNSTSVQQAATNAMSKLGIN